MYTSLSYHKTKTVVNATASRPLEYIAWGIDGGEQTCPKRYARKMAWASCAGFQLTSKITTRLAPTRFTPRDPA